MTIKWLCKTLQHIESLFAAEAWDIMTTGKPFSLASFFFILASFVLKDKLPETLYESCTRFSVFTYICAAKMMSNVPRMH